jgi:hypothetical protein
MAKFSVSATKTIFVYDTIEADSIDEAYEMIDSSEYELDFYSGDVEVDVIIEPMGGK